MSRIYSLDYLRGLAALGILVYHYSSSIYGAFEMDTFLGRVGVYGVSLFYVLSGLTLFHVYYHQMSPSRQDVILFFKKRVFRIYPLMWLVIILTTIFFRRTPDLWDLFLNLTGFFGVVKWDTFFSAGLWSVGNELVFYSFFPVFVLLTKSYKKIMALLSIAIFSVYLYFAFIKINQPIMDIVTWKDYTNPLNQLFLFLGGFLIGIFLEQVKIKNTLNIMILIFGIALFILYPAHGNTINIITNTNRLVFTFICFIICIAFYKLSFKLPELIHRPLILLGEISYAVYLFHQLVYDVIERILFFFVNRGFHFPPVFKLILPLIITLGRFY